MATKIATTDDMKQYHRWVLTVLLVFATIFFGGQRERDHFGDAPNPLENGVTGTLYISPFGVADTIHAVLQETKYRLYGRQYQITYDDTTRLLKNKAILGTDVKLLLEDSTYGWNTQARRKFRDAIAQAPVQVKNDDALGTNYIHAKSFVTDDAFIVSTANLWYPWFFSNREYRFVSRDPELVAAMQYVFERDWEGSRILARWLPDGVVMCPINCRTSIMNLLSSAQESIKIQAQYITDPSIISLLRAKQESGVEVIIITSNRQERAPLQWLKWVNILEQPYVHAKNVLVDDTKLFVGSMNFSQNAIENNREMNIITTDQYAIRRFNGQFLVDLEDTVPFEEEWRKR